MCRAIPLETLLHHYAEAKRYKFTDAQRLYYKSIVAEVGPVLPQDIKDDITVEQLRLIVASRTQNPAYILAHLCEREGIEVDPAFIAAGVAYCEGRADGPNEAVTSFLLATGAGMACNGIASLIAGKPETYGEYQERMGEGGSFPQGQAEALFFGGVEVARRVNGTMVFKGEVGWPEDKPRKSPWQRFKGLLPYLLPWASKRG